MPVLGSGISTHNKTKTLAYKVYDCYKKVHEITIHKPEDDTFIQQRLNEGR